MRKLGAEAQVPSASRRCRIATTSSRRAADALDVLASLDIRFAILHGLSAFEAARATSDIDLVVATPVALVVPKLVRALPEQGLHLIVEWSYDIGGATTLMLSTHDGGEGVQLDLLFDVHGRGVDGVMTPWIIRQMDAAGRWPCANAVHELLYLIRKRQRKNDEAAMRALVERALREHPRDRLRMEAFKIFRVPVARSVCAVLDGASTGLIVRQPAAPAHRVRRWGQRLARPVGFWAECETSSSSDARVTTVAETFGRFMPYSRAGRRPDGAGASLSWFARDVAPVRWRPGLFVSSTASRDRRIPRADLVIEREASASEIRTQIVAAMELRLRVA